MKRIILSFYILFLIVDFSVAQDKMVQIETGYGNIKVRLYNETPLHRDNFVRLAEKGFYDSLLFHRVIKNFVIQGGDPDSKHARQGQFLGDGDVGYWLPAEFHPQYFHKRGVVAAARESDIINPKQSSSGCQFYIVQGKIYNDSLLAKAEKRMTRMRAYNRVVNKTENQPLIEQYKRLAEKKAEDSLQLVNKQIDSLTNEELKKIPPYVIPQNQKEVYKTTGGIPHLDGSYTIFGEVTEGMEVVDKLAVLPTDSNDRPVPDVRMKVKLLK